MDKNRQKKRLNIYLSIDSIKVLKQAAASLGGRQNASYGKLIDYAVKKTFQNKEEILRDKIRHHQKALMEYADELRELESRRDDESIDKSERRRLATALSSSQE